MTGKRGASRDDERLAVLDAFRAIAILAVLVHHYFSRWAPPDHPENLYGYADTYPQWLDLGALGVQFFFIISGFVIFMTLERCTHLFEFWVRRLGRLYPAYVVATLITFAIVNLLGPSAFQSSFSDVAIGLAFMTTFVPDARFIEPAYWSLIVEMQFYFWIGLLYALSRGRFIFVWCTFVLLGLALWVAGSAETLHALRTVSRYVLLAPYLPHFTAGMLFYRLHSGRTTGTRALAAVAALGYLLTMHDQSAAFHAVNAAMIAMFALFLGGRLEWLALRPLLFVGSISYSLYLLHQYLGVMLIGWLTAVTGLPDLAAAAGAAGACVALAFALTTWVEQPAKRWLLRGLRDRLAPAGIRWPRLTFRRERPDQIA